MIKKVLLFALFNLTALFATAQQFLLSGRVTDFAGNPVPFTSVYVKGTSQGTASNANGIYSIQLKPGKYQLNFRTIGFTQQTEAIERAGNNLSHNVSLHVENYALGDKSATADEVIKQAIAQRESHLTELKAYRCNVYIKGVQKLLHAPGNLFSVAVSHELQVDTGQNNILYMSESESGFSFEQSGKTKEVMISSKIVGSNNAFNFNRAAALQVNFYQNLFDIEGINPRGFVSPIADNAPDYYRYKLLGCATENGKLIYKIQVIPIREHDPVFTGNIYIVDGDWRIYAAHLFVTQNAGLNFVDTLNINQQYISLAGDTWQPASVSFTYSGNVLGFKYSGYILGVYSNYELAPNFPPRFFNGENIRITQQSLSRDSVYWAQNRPVPLTPDERRNYHRQDSIAKKHNSPSYLDSLERANNKFSPIGYVFSGDSIAHRANKTALVFPPLYRTIYFNTVEGMVLYPTVDYTKKLDSGKQYIITPKLRYGFSDRQFSANIGFSYSYNPHQRGIVYGRFGSDVFDLNSEGSSSLFINTLGTLFFKDNVLKLYRSNFARLGLQRNVAHGLLLDGSLEYARRNAMQNTTYFKLLDSKDKEFTSNNPLKPNLPDTTLLFTPNNALTLLLSATYTFDEEYTSKPDGIVYDTNKYPKIKLSYRKGIHTLLGSNVDYDYADVQVFQSHIKLGLVGYSSFVVKAGKFFNSDALIYPDYKQFKGNEGITFDPAIGSFHFLPYYTYSNTAFLEAHYEHDFSGFLFNKIPGLRTLKLEEIAGTNYLAQQSQPGYSEFYIGIQRYFFRLDYGLAYTGSNRVNQGFAFYYGF